MDQHEANAIAQEKLRDAYLAAAEQLIKKSQAGEDSQEAYAEFKRLFDASNALTNADLDSLIEALEAEDKASEAKPAPRKGPTIWFFIASSVAGVVGLTEGMSSGNGWMTALGVAGCLGQFWYMFRDFRG